MNVRRLILEYQYGYSKYGGWVIQLLTLIFSAIAAVRGSHFAPLLLPLILIGAALGFYGMILLGRHEVLRSGGFSGLEHAILTARNPVWSMYLAIMVKLLREEGHVEEANQLVAVLSKYMDPNDPARAILEGVSEGEGGVVVGSDHS